MSVSVCLCTSNLQSVSSISASASLSPWGSDNTHSSYRRMRRIKYTIFNRMLKCVWIKTVLKKKANIIQYNMLEAGTLGHVWQIFSFWEKNWKPFPTQPPHSLCKGFYFEGAGWNQIAPVNHHRPPLFANQEQHLMMAFVCVTPLMRHFRLPPLLSSCVSQLQPLHMTNELRDSQCGRFLSPDFT